MSDIELLLALVAATVALVWVARVLNVPYPAFLVVGGLGIGLLPGVPELNLDPDVVFLIFIPPLVHASAWAASPRHLRDFARPIGQLAILLVVLTLGVVALVAHTLVDGMSWQAALVLGAIVAPTDPVAATAIFRRLGVPPHVTTLVEGESLLNDATALVAYRIAVAAIVAGTYSVLDGAVALVLVSAGGVVVGLALAWLVAQAHRRLDDTMIQVAVTFITPYVAYIVAEEAHTSGIIAAVVSGLYLGWKSTDFFTPSTRIQAWSFWEVTIFLLESVLFILIGLQFPGVVDRLSGTPAGELALYAAAIAAAVIAVRFLFLFTVAELDESYEESVRGQRRPRITRSERIVVAWSGMRGAVSLAAALAIPLTTDAGTPFPQRDLILFLTLSTIGVTLLVQGLTLPALIRRLKVEDTRSGAHRRANARFSTVQAALDHISDLSFDDDVPPGVVERARNMYTSRARQLAGQCQIGVEVEAGDDEAWSRLRRDLIEVERRALLGLRDEGKVPNRVMIDVERDLDLEESRLDSRPFQSPVDAEREPAPK
jgi:CPA1 family monovalent cation:H+ antiporter